MLVKLMYQDAECIMNGDMHVNPRHIVSVCMRDDGCVAHMQLDAPLYTLQLDGSQLAQTTFDIDIESYRKIVWWMETHDE